MAEIKDKLQQLLSMEDWTTKEKKWILQYLNTTDESELRDLMHEQFEVDINGSYQIDPEKSKEIFQNIRQKVTIENKQGRKSIVRKMVLRLAVASCVIGVIGFSVYFLSKNNIEINTVSKNKPKKVYNNDVLPGGNKAVLTLADKSVILLDDAQNGAVAMQGNTKVVKLNGKIAYTTLGSKKEGEILYNTISTPRGGQYQIELPDGSQVWMNSASTLRFPTVFIGKERKVEITGEAYFEVAKNKSMPFIVKVNDAEIQVLGTHFNVMAYHDEAIVKTTLLEGSINFVANGVTNMLTPGQQSQLSRDNVVKVVSDVDLGDVMAWKNGIFHFQGEDIGVVLRQLTRWYDVEVVSGKVVNDLFYAEIPRDTKLSDVLRALELTGKVHFQIQGRKIIVMP